MASYFRSYADDGRTLVQIDDDYSNHSLAEKRVVTLALTNNNFGDDHTVVFNGPESPILAAIMPNAGFFVRNYSRSGNTHTFVINVRGLNVSSTTATFYFFVPFQPTPGAGVGMRIRRPSDLQVVFDSRFKYLRVLGVLAGKDQPSNSDINMAAPAGHVYAIAPCWAGAKLRREAYTDGFGGWYIHREQWQWYAYANGNAGSGVTASWLKLDDTTTGGWDGEIWIQELGSTQVFALALDVTNY